MVGVIDADDEFAAVVPGEEIVEEGGLQRAEVEVSGRRGCESDADLCWRREESSLEKDQGALLDVHLKDRGRKAENS